MMPCLCLPFHTVSNSRTRLEKADGCPKPNITLGSIVCVGGQVRVGEPVKERLKEASEPWSVVNRKRRVKGDF